jgi:rubrerythrin
MTDTLQNLQTAFAGESQANRKYLAFAKKAEQEGYPQIARLFRAAAHGETIHALNHLAAMDGIGTTEENLKEAFGGETYEFESMYPPMMETATAEANKQAFRTFRMANEVEKIHAGMYQEALELLSSEMETYGYYVCPVCGYLHARCAPDRCPVCNNPGKNFELIS